MALTHVRQQELLEDERTEESEAVLEEVIEASLHPDRAHHDELGRTHQPPEDGEQPPSPREQPAAPLDVTKTDE